MRCSPLLLLAIAAAAGATRDAPGATQGRLLAFFIPNHGQAPASVRFMSQGSGITCWFLDREILFSLDGKRVRLSFEGALSDSHVQGMNLLVGRVNFLSGPPENWRTDIPVFEGAVYIGLYPGIDMAYSASGRRLKSEFRVAPGADPGSIRLRYAGGDPPRIDADGSLLLSTPAGTLRESAPVAWQTRAGVRIPVETHFDLRRDDTVGFIIGGYDPSLQLIIDPVVAYSTLLGGSGQDAANAVAVDSAGAAYVAGSTASYDFPALNPAQSAIGGSNDAFVAKLTASGNALIYCTYLGGAGDDRAMGIAVDASGAAYITGYTQSPNFPVRNALQATLAGTKNAFIAKLTPAGNNLAYSTYLGGSGSDSGNGIAVDSSGNAYVAGDATSANFPVNSFQRTYHGGQDAFVVKLNPGGSGLIYSTYLGGGNIDHASGIALDSTGTAYVAGGTFSTDFPLMNASQVSAGGGEDAFIARLKADGSGLLFSTYLGGSGGSNGYPELAQGIAVDSGGNAYIAGVTSSSNFPVLNPVQATLNGSSDAFAAEFSPAGGLIFSTYLGGSGSDSANAIAVDANGFSYIAGYTFSGDFPLVTALQNWTGGLGATDAFVAKFAPGGASLVFSTYLGGSDSDSAVAIAADSGGNIFVAGFTLSSNFPVVNPFQSQNVGNFGAFVAKYIFNIAPANSGVSPASGSGSAQTFTFQYSDGNGAGDLSVVSMSIGPSNSQAAACAVVYNIAHNTLALLTDSGAMPASAISPGVGTAQNSQCVLNGAASGVSLSGATLTLTLAIAFQPTFAGAKNIYMQAANPYQTTPWQVEGTWSVSSGPAPSVSVSITHNGNFAQGQTGAASTIVVSNSAGAGATSGAVSVTLALAPGFSLSALSGTGWSCSGAACSRSDALAAGASFPPLTLTLNVAASAASPLTNSVTVSGGGSAAAGSSDTITVTSASSMATSIFSASSSPGNPWQNDSPVTLGVKFRSDVAGMVTAIRFYKGIGNNGTHIGLLYDGNGNLLGQATFTSESASGWQQVSLPAPVAIAANTTYVACYYSTSGYAHDPGYFTAAGVDNPPLHALRSGVDGLNGVYIYGLGPQFPPASFNSTNYWADLVFAPASLSSTAALTVAISHNGNLTQGQTGATASITVSDQTGAGATSGTVTVNVTLASGFSFSALSGTGWTCSGASCSRSDALAAGASYPPLTLTFNVAASAASPLTNSVTVSGGGSAAVGSSDTITVTPAASIPISIFSASSSPGNPWQNDSPVTLGVKFRSDVAGMVTAIRFYKGLGNNGTHIGLLYDGNGNLLGQATFSSESASGWQQVSLPAPVAIAANTTYVACYYSTSGYAHDLGYFTGAGVDNPPLHALRSGVDGLNGVYIYGLGPQFPPASFNSTNYWADVLFVPGSAGAIASSLSSTENIFSPAATPAIPWHNDSSVTVGVKFRSDIQLSIHGIRFYKGVGNNGTHIGLLYDANGNLLGQAVFASESPSGWQQASFSTPVKIAAGATYVAALFSTSGFAYTVSFFTNSGVDNPPLHALKSGVDGPNGIYAYGPLPQFPIYSLADAAYWVDIF